MPDDNDLISRIRCLPGIRNAFFLKEEDRFQLLEIETEAEKKSFMGLGMCYNSGIREVLKCPVVIVAITSMDFDWGCKAANILLKKDGEIVGEEVRDPTRIRQLEKDKNIWFLHKNFIIHKDKVNFPSDIVQKKCCFELPAIDGEQSAPGFREFANCIYCSPSTAADIFLKKKYYEDVDERGTGTVLVGFKES